MTIYVSVCQNCLPSAEREAPTPVDVQTLLEKLAAAHIKAEIVEATCLGVCTAPASLALQSKGRASYVFADIDIQHDAADIVATCAAYLAAEDGWIEDARPCGRLRTCLKARLPALP